MTTLLVNLFGLLLMAAIVWWFWLYRSGPSGGRGRLKIAGAKSRTGDIEKEKQP